MHDFMLAFAERLRAVKRDKEGEPTETPVFSHVSIGPLSRFPEQTPFAVLELQTTGRVRVTIYVLLENAEQSEKELFFLAEMFRYTFLMLSGITGYFQYNGKIYRTLTYFANLL